jgi:hypothetical protein
MLVIEPGSSKGFLFHASCLAALILRLGINRLIFAQNVASEYNKQTGGEICRIIKGVLCGVEAEGDEA